MRHKLMRTLGFGAYYCVGSLKSAGIFVPIFQYCGTHWYKDAPFAPPVHPAEKIKVILPMSKLKHGQIYHRVHYPVGRRCGKL